MQLVEQHIIKSTHKFYKELDRLCFLSKNLYNVANYMIRQEFTANGNYLNSYSVDKLLNVDNVDYKQLPSKVSQQTLKLLDQNWKSFFQAVKSYKKNSNRFLDRPKLPKYKDKVKGRNPVIYTIQAISKKELRKGVIKLSKTSIHFKTKVPVDSINQVRVVPKPNKVIVIEVIYTVQEKEVLKNSNILGIDLGVNNLATCVNTVNTDKFIINGKPLKSMNQFFNKKRATLMSYVGDKGNSNRTQKLTNKRNNKVKNYLHKASKYVINYCLTNDISTVVLGHNKEWKQEVNTGKRNNQNFVSIPFTTLINQLKYKGQLQGITVLETEESYTSKCSFIMSESLEHHESYLGKRVKRGLYRCNGTNYNADVNGALNIIRKVIPTFSVADYGIQGVVVHPTKVTL